MEIRAAVLSRMGVPGPYADTKPLSVESVRLEGPREGEVLVRIAAAGLCHSDLSVINGDRPRPLPMVLGHEASGVVEEVGPGVDDLTPGDHVVFVFVPSCGCCPQCATGHPVLCEPAAVTNAAGELPGGQRRLSYDSASVNHHNGVSAFAEYATASRRSLIKIDPEVPLDIAALFGCAVITGAGSVMNTACVEPGSSVAVVGLGGVGLSAVMGALAAGAERIVAVDLDPAKLEIASSLGATELVNARDPDAVAAVRGARGVDSALEFAGSSQALELAWATTRRGGVTVTAGLPNPAIRFPVPIVSLVSEERTLKGSYLGGGVPSRDIPRLLNLWRRGRLPVERLMTHRITLDEINEGFDRLAASQAIRQIITFGT